MANKQTPKQQPQDRCTNPILLLPMSTLRLWGTSNPNEGDVGAIAASIERFGFNGALRVWRDNTIVAGNHSLMALMSLKARGPRGIHEKGQLPWPPEHVMVDKKSSEWLIPCLDVSHLDELDAKAYLIADNDIARKANQDAAKKAQYLIELQQERPESLKAAGWDAEALDEFLSGIARDIVTPPFDATKVEGAYDPGTGAIPPGTYILYISFDSREGFDRLLGQVAPERTLKADNQYATIKGELVLAYLDSLQADDGNFNEALMGEDI